MISDELRPRPVADELTQPFWDGARERRLMIQRCQQCRTYFHPPLPRCDICDSDDLGFEAVSGHGTIYTFTVMHSPGFPAFASATPYAVVSVELVEQSCLVMTCNMDGTDLADLQIGAPVEVTFVDIGDRVTLPDFELSASEAS